MSNTEILALRQVPIVDTKGRLRAILHADSVCLKPPAPGGLLMLAKTRQEPSGVYIHGDYINMQWVRTMSRVGTTWHLLANEWPHPSEWQVQACTTVWSPGPPPKPKKDDRTKAWQFYYQTGQAPKEWRKKKGDTTLRNLAASSAYHAPTWIAFDRAHTADDLAAFYSWSDEKAVAVDSWVALTKKPRPANGSLVWVCRHDAATGQTVRNIGLVYGCLNVTRAGTLELMQLAPGQTPKIQVLPFGSQKDRQFWWEHMD